MQGSLLKEKSTKDDVAHNQAADSDVGESKCDEETTGSFDLRYYPSSSVLQITHLSIRPENQRSQGRLVTVHYDAVHVSQLGQHISAGIDQSKGRESIFLPPPAGFS